MTDVQLERHPEFRNDGLAYSTLRSRRKELVDMGLVSVCGRERHGAKRSLTVWGVKHKPGRSQEVKSPHALVIGTLLTERRVD